MIIISEDVTNHAYTIINEDMTNHAYTKLAEDPQLRTKAAYVNSLTTKQILLLQTFCTMGSILSWTKWNDIWCIQISGFFLPSCF